MREVPAAEQRSIIAFVAACGIIPIMIGGSVSVLTIGLWTFPIILGLYIACAFFVGQLLIYLTMGALDGK